MNGYDAHSLVAMAEASTHKRMPEPATTKPTPMRGAVGKSISEVSSGNLPPWLRKDDDDDGDDDDEGTAKAGAKSGPKGATTKSKTPAKAAAKK